MNKIEQLQSDIEKIEKGLNSTLTDERFKEGLRKIVKDKKDELESLMKDKKEEPKKQEPKKQEVKKVEPVKKQAPEKKSGVKTSKQILDDCREILSRHNKEKKTAVQRIKERKKQGKPATLTPSETVSKTAKIVKSKVVDMKGVKDNGLPVSEVNKLSSGIVATVKSTLSGIKNNVEKQKFLNNLISEIKSLGSNLTKVAMQGGLFADGGNVGLLYDGFQIYGTDESGWYAKDVIKNKWIKPINSMVWESEMDVYDAINSNQYKYQFADGGMFERGGRYNTGRSWTLDHNQHNKSESYEVSKGDRRYEGGGGIDLLADMSGAELQNVGGTSFSNADLTSHMDITHPMFAKGGGVFSTYQIWHTPSNSLIVFDKSTDNVKEIREWGTNGMNGKIKSEINIEGVIYRKNKIYNTYNSVMGNEILSKHNFKKSEFADGGMFEQGGRYNTGRSWTLDHNQHNKSESYEVSKGDRKFGAGGMNMEEYLEKKKYSYEEGGDIADSNTEMLMSKIRELQHHTSEIQKLVDTNTKVEAWVVAKAERSATDLSDITHYIDGKKSMEGANEKFAHGGTLGSVEVIFDNPEYNYTTSIGANVTEDEARKYFVGKMFDMGVYPTENFQKCIDIKFHTKDSYANGGAIDNIDELVGKYINVFSLGVKEPYNEKIVSATLDPKKFSKRFLNIETLGGGIEQVPLNLIEQFYNFNQIELKDSKGEPYIIELSKSGRMAKGGLTEHGLQIGDKIIDRTSFDENSISVMNDGRYAMVDLDKGERIEGIYANGGTLKDKFQIVNSKGYFSRSMKTGKPIFINNFELGYTYTKDDAQKMLEFLKKETNNSDLKVVPFASVKFNDEFANGGIMAKDGEIEYRVEYEVFVDDADDPYTDNRLKTFKDLDEAIEFANRVYASVDYEIIKDGEVVDYGYVNTTNKKLSKFENGGETDDDMGVQFIDYKDKMIMYEPHYKEYYTNDIQFDSLEKAKKYIDSGSKMTPAQINAYRMGAMADGGSVNKYYIRWDSINSRGGVNRNNKELSELPKNIVVNQSNYVFIKKDTINGKDYVPVRIIGGFKGVQLSEQEIKDKKIKRIETMEFADGGKMAKGGTTSSKFPIVTIFMDADGQDGLEELYDYLEQEQGISVDNSKNYKKDKGTAQESYTNDDYLILEFNKSDLKNVKKFEKKFDDLYFPEYEITYQYGQKMAKGGTTTFNDKVKSITQSLLKRKKVSPSVQKDYGKTYDKKEAIESAKRIAGAIRSKEMAKKKS